LTLLLFRDKRTKDAEIRKRIAVHAKAEDTMTPTEILKHEHKMILMVIDAIEKEVREVERTGKVDAERIGKMIDFVRNFADRCHHAKEEDILFVRMREKGMPSDSGPIAVMLKEHADGRKNISLAAGVLQKAAEGDGPATTTMKNSLLAYAGLLRAHIQKEDNVLYPMADHMLSPEDLKDLIEAFDRVEREEIGEGVHKKYHELAQELSS
jgi:hemerythrin-like domain-containing protein